MWVQTWEGCWLTGWWKLQRNTSLFQTPSISPFRILIGSFLSMFSIARSFSCLGFLLCSLPRKRPLTLFVFFSSEALILLCLIANFLAAYDVTFVVLYQVESMRKLALQMWKIFATLRIIPTPKTRWWKWRPIYSSPWSLNWEVPLSRHFWGEDSFFF